MDYSPKLRKVSTEIKKILNDNDIAGFFILHSPDYSEYVNCLETSYSAAIVTEDSIRLSLKKSEVGIEEFKKRSKGTYNMVTHFANVLAMHATFYQNLQLTLKEKWNGKEENSIHSPSKN